MLNYLIPKLTGCKKVNTDCQCSVLGADACSKLPYTICCDDECQCLPYTSPHAKNKKCVPDCLDFLYISDGSTVSPFQIVASFNKQFHSIAGSEPAAANMFGLKPNNMALRVEGTVSY